MATKAGRFSKRAQESSLGRLVDQILYDGATKNKAGLSYEIDFIESAQGLGITLYPAQRMIAKAIFGTPLDYRQGIVEVWDTMKTTLRYKMPETEFLKFLYEEGRCNVPDWRDIPARGFGTSVLAVGRRGGKSALVSGIAAACLRNLLAIYDPQSFYNLIPGSTVDFTIIGTDQDSSDRLYSKIRADINRSPFFAPYMRSVATAKEMRFVSEADRGRRDIDPSITVKSFACTTRAVRGPSSYFLALDEFAHFQSKKDSNSDDLYTAATPSTSQFPSKEDPDVSDSRILVISSPLNKIGKFYELHKRALDLGMKSDIFTVRLSTVEMNSKIPRTRLEAELQDNPDSFPAEFGGEFLDGSGSYVPAVKYDVCVDENRTNLTRFDINTVGRKYFWGLDYGMKNDGTALAISHLELIDNFGIMLVFDYIDRMIVGEPFEGPGLSPQAAANVANLKELNLVEVVSWLTYMHQILPCYKGLTDQHGGATLKQLLQLNGITTMGLEHLNDQTNSKMYMALRGYVSNERARFPNVPKFANEFKQLEASFKSKYVLKVEAPGEKDAHDDMADAAALSAWQAQTWLEEHGMLDLDPSARVLQVDPRVLNPTSYINPNDVTMRDLKVHVRALKTGDGLLLPPNLPVVQNPFGRRHR